LNKLESELFALTHRGNSGDRAFYAKACAKAEHVLELGTGYGRLIPSLLVGHGRGPKPALAREVWGLDRDTQLLAAARIARRALGSAQRKQVKLIAGDMSNFAFDQAFERIILPYNGLYCLLNRRNIVRCLKCVKRHLAPEGEFIFDVWAADNFHQNASAREYHDDTGPILSIAHRAQTWDVYEKSHLRSGAQRLDVTYTYISRQNGTRLTIAIAQRYAPSRELIKLVCDAGLRVKALYGSFSEGGYSPNSPVLIVKAVSG